MGSLRRFDLERICADYHIGCFFETGTFRGDGVAYASKRSFKNIVSVEIIPSIAAAAKERFKTEPRVEIVEGGSTDALQDMLPHLLSNCLFWLDAHFPGADAGLTAYDENMDEGQRLPLAAELDVIYKLRSGFDDVIIIDDLRIYEDGPYSNGNVPADALPKFNRNIDFIYQLFEKTHFIIRSYLDEGYVILLPVPWYKRLMYSLFGITSKPPSVDGYLNEVVDEMASV